MVEMPSRYRDRGRGASGRGVHRLHDRQENRRAARGALRHIRRNPPDKELGALRETCAGCLPRGAPLALSSREFLIRLAVGLREDPAGCWAPGYRRDPWQLRAARCPSRPSEPGAGGQPPGSPPHAPVRPLTGRLAALVGTVQDLDQLRALEQPSGVGEAIAANRSSAALRSTYSARCSFQVLAVSRLPFLIERGGECVEPGTEKFLAGRSIDWRRNPRLRLEARETLAQRGTRAPDPYRPRTARTRRRANRARVPRQHLVADRRGQRFMADLYLRPVRLIGESLA